MLDYSTLYSVQQKLLVGEILSSPEQEVWFEFYNSTIFDIRCKQLVNEPLSQEDKLHWQIYACAYPDRIKNIITEENLREYGKYLRQAPAAYENFIRNYLPAIVQNPNLPG